MKIDLFATTCFSHETDDFSIDDKQPAIIVPFKKGIADVENPNNRSIYFIPLDKNIECLRSDGNMESQCDALLICLRPQDKVDFYFVELKDIRTPGTHWISSGSEQLKTTINTFERTYDLSCLAKRMAFLANKKHPAYHFSHIELMEKFRSETGFRLNICAIIPIK
jgi:hypothetical protein